MTKTKADSVESRVERVLTGINDFLGAAHENAPILAIALGVAHDGILTLVRDEGGEHSVEMVRDAVRVFAKRMTVKAELEG